MNQTATNYHRRAMFLADSALEFQARSKDEAARKWFALASEREWSAVQACPPDLQPSRAVLCRSAASLALSAGQRERAAEMAQVGLEGEPPAEVAEELREVLRQATASPSPATP